MAKDQTVQPPKYSKLIGSEQMHKTLYQGRDLALDVHMGGHSTSIVTFEARNQYIDAIKPSTFGAGFGKGSFAPLGFNEFLIRRSRNHWYQTPEMLFVAEIINKIARGTKVITYGGSMGGFAAINFAPMLNANSFIALSPLFDVQDGNEAGEVRWQEGKDLDFPYNFIKAGACRSASGYAFFARGTPDERHAELLGRETNARLVPLEFGGHPCSFYLNDTYKIKTLLVEIASGTFNEDDFYAKLNEQTKETHYPYDRLATQLEMSGNIDEAIQQMRIAIRKKPSLPSLYNRLGNLLLKQDELDEAGATFLKSIEMDPTNPWVYIRLSYVYAARMDFEKAVGALEKAIDISPERPEFHLRLGEWLIRKGDLVAAERAILKAIEIKPNAVIAPVRLRDVRKMMKKGWW